MVVYCINCYPGLLCTRTIQGTILCRVRVCPGIRCRWRRIRCQLIAPRRQPAWDGHLNSNSHHRCSRCRYDLRNKRITQTQSISGTPAELDPVDPELIRSVRIGLQAVIPATFQRYWIHTVIVLIQILSHSAICVLNLVTLKSVPVARDVKCCRFMMTRMIMMITIYGIYIAPSIICVL